MVNVKNKRGRSPPLPKSTLLTCSCKPDGAEDLPTESTTNTRIMVDLSAQGGSLKGHEAILDSGSAHSLISCELARTLDPKMDFKKRIRFKGVKGTVSTTLGAASLEVQLAGRKLRFRFHVAPEPPDGVDPGWSMIIGT